MGLTPARPYTSRMSPCVGCEKGTASEPPANPSACRTPQRREAARWTCDRSGFCRIDEEAGNQRRIGLAGPSRAGYTTPWGGPDMQLKLRRAAVRCRPQHPSEARSHLLPMRVGLAYALVAVLVAGANGCLAGSESPEVGAATAAARHPGGTVVARGGTPPQRSAAVTPSSRGARVGFRTVAERTAYLDVRARADRERVSTEYRVGRAAAAATHVVRATVTHIRPTSRWPDWRAATLHIDEVASGTVSPGSDVTVLRRSTASLTDCTGNPPFRLSESYIASLVPSERMLDAYELAPEAGALVAESSPGVFRLHDHDSIRWSDVRRIAGSAP